MVVVLISDGERVASEAHQYLEQIVVQTELHDVLSWITKVTAIRGDRCNRSFVEYCSQDFSSVVGSRLDRIESAECRGEARPSVLFCCSEEVLPVVAEGMPGESLCVAEVFLRVLRQCDAFITLVVVDQLSELPEELEERGFVHTGRF